MKFRAVKIKQKGITLIETLVLTAILGAGSHYAFFEYQNYSRQQAVQEVFKHFIYSLSAARSEAKNSKTPVSICLSYNAKTCSNDSSANGWIVFIDDGRGKGFQSNKRRELDEKLLVSFSAPIGIAPQLVDFEDKRYFSIGFDENGFSTEVQRIYATVTDDHQTDSYEKKSKIDRSGFISGVDHRRAIASIDAARKNVHNSL